MRYLFVLAVLVLAGCTEALAPSEPDFARKRYPPGVIPCIPEDGCIIIPNP